MPKQKAQSKRSIESEIKLLTLFGRGSILTTAQARARIGVNPDRLFQFAELGYLENRGPQPMEHSSLGWKITQKGLTRLHELKTSTKA